VRDGSNADQKESERPFRLELRLDYFFRTPDVEIIRLVGAEVVALAQQPVDFVDRRIDRLRGHRRAHDIVQPGVALPPEPLLRGGVGQ